MDINNKCYYEKKIIIFKEIFISYAKSKSYFINLNTV